MWNCGSEPAFNCTTRCVWHARQLRANTSLYKDSALAGFALAKPQHQVKRDASAGLGMIVSRELPGSDKRNRGRSRDVLDGQYRAACSNDPLDLVDSAQCAQHANMVL